MLRDEGKALEAEQDAMKARWGLLVVPASVWYGLFFFVPVGIFLLISFRPHLGAGEIGTSWTFANYARFALDPYYWKVFGLTLRLTAEATTWTLVLGFPLAYYLVRSTSLWVRWIIPLVLASSFVTGVIRALGWMVILGTNGPVNKLLVALGIISAPLRLAPSYWGLLVGFVHLLLPLMVLILLGVLQTIPRDLEEAAENLGASRARVFRRVVLPLALPGVATASLMVFSIAMAVFTTTVMLGGGLIFTLPVMIYQEVLQKVNYPFGSTIAAILTISVLALNLIANTAMHGRVRLGRRSA